MKKISKILSIILSIMMIISIVPLTASAATVTGTCGDNLIWTYDTSTYTLTISGTGAMNNYVYNNRPWKSYEDSIKNVVIESGVTSIGSYTFEDCDSLTSVTIPDSVTTIGEYAFYSCDSLTSVYITDIFAWCNIDFEYVGSTPLNYGADLYLNGEKVTDLVIPDGVTSIDDSAFANCDSFTSVTIPDSVATIGNYAFSNCDSLTSVTIPDSVTTIGDSAFSNCDSLTSITVDSNNQYYSSDESGVLFNKDKTKLIQYPIGNTRISYTIPDSVATIGNSVFENCQKLANVTIPDSVTSINTYSFYYCDSLTNITVDSDNQYYSSDEYGVLFNKDKTTLIQYPIGNTRTSYTIPDSVTSIDYNAFELCNSLTSVTIPDSVTGIGSGAFYGCYSLTDVNYSGTKYQWNKIYIGSENDNLTYARIHCNYNSDTHITSAIITPPTCTADGYTTYTCECGYNYKADYTDSTGHSYDSVVTPPTCTAKGYTTYTCACGYSYKSDYTDATGHRYDNNVVTPPTCTAKGYTTYTCECGHSYKSDYTNATGHSYTSQITTPATHLTTGVMTFTCACGYSYTETIAKTTEHIYNALATAPTCTEKGYTTYTCVCGYSYVGNYTSATGHTLAWQTLSVASCNTNGVEHGYCQDCSYFEVETTPQTDHADNDGDGKCDSCAYTLCNHNCHKGGITGFFWKISNFFNMLFKTNKYCSCGIAHY